MSQERYPLRRSFAIHIGTMGRVLVIVGLVVTAVGLLWPWVVRLGLGHLPDDIHIRTAHGAFYFPLHDLHPGQCRLVAAVVADQSLGFAACAA